jgi:hypothetical protein
VTGALPALPRRKGNGHPRAVAVASATAGLALGTAAGAVLFTQRDEPAADGGEEQAPSATEE